MGDSPSLNFLPLFSDTYVQDIFNQFASFAYVLLVCFQRPVNLRLCSDCGGNSINTLECLRSASIATLTRAGSRVIGARTTTLFVFAPIIDGAFLAERPVEAFGNGHFSSIPVLYG